MSELSELIHALSHQSEACYHTISSNQRVHAYSMVAGLANLESRVLTKGDNTMATDIDKGIKTCISCIKSTAASGKCFYCTKDLLKPMEREIASQKSAHWGRMKIKG